MSKWSSWTSSLRHRECCGYQICKDRHPPESTSGAERLRDELLTQVRASRDMLDVPARGARADQQTKDSPVRSTGHTGAAVHAYRSRISSVVVPTYYDVDTRPVRIERIQRHGTPLGTTARGHISRNRRSDRRVRTKDPTATGVQRLSDQYDTGRDASSV